MSIRNSLANKRARKAAKLARPRKPSYKVGPLDNNKYDAQRHNVPKSQREIRPPLTIIRDETDPERTWSDPVVLAHGLRHPVRGRKFRG